MNARFLRDPVIGVVCLLCLAVVGALVVLALASAPDRAWEKKARLAAERRESQQAWYDDETTRAQYPFESLAGPLEYESKQTPPTASVRMTDESKQRLEHREGEHELEYRNSSRRAALLMIHHKEAMEFIEREGQGLERMLVNPQYLELPEEEPVLLARATTLDPGGGPALALPREDSNTEQELPSVAGLFSFHQNGELDFVNLRNAGFVKDRERVAGFRPHRFSKMPVLKSPFELQLAAKARWQLRRLELVSLLKHDKPAVYLSDTLPRMDRLKSAPTRALTAFEEQALQSLQGGEDLSIEATVNQIRMLGSLRATKTCLQCHHGARGELLGAFSYVLERHPRLKVPEGPAPAP